MMSSRTIRPPLPTLLPRASDPPPLAEYVPVMLTSSVTIPLELMRIFGFGSPSRIVVDSQKMSRSTLRAVRVRSALTFAAPPSKAPPLALLIRVIRDRTVGSHRTHVETGRAEHRVLEHP